MLDTKDIILTLKQNKEELYKQFFVQNIGVFGSFARNEQKDNSDIDFLVEFFPNTTNLFDVKQSLKEYLKSKFQREIDLANPKYLKPYVKEKILNETIYVK